MTPTVAQQAQPSTEWCEACGCSHAPDPRPCETSAEPFDSQED